MKNNYFKILMGLIIGFLIILLFYGLIPTFGKVYGPQKYNTLIVNSNTLQQGYTITKKLKLPDRVKFPAISNEVVYYGSNNSFFYALNSRTGSLLWKYDAESIVCTSIAFSDAMVYFGTWDGHIHALDKATGQEMWNFTTGFYINGAPIIVSPRVSKGILYFESYSSDFYALDAQTGLQKWVVKTNASFRTKLHKLVFKPNPTLRGIINAAPPAIGDGLVCFGGDDVYLYALDVNTGEKRWRFYTGDYVDVTPAIVDKTIYFGTGNGDFYAVDSTTGRQKWVVQTGYSIKSSPTISEGTVYFGNSHGYLYALDAKTGMEKRKIKALCSINSSPAIANGTVYFASDDGNLYATDLYGQGKWNCQTGGKIQSPLFMIDGTLYFLCADDYIYALHESPQLHD